MNVPPAAGQTAEKQDPQQARLSESAARLEQAFAQHQDELLGTLFYLVGNIDDARDTLQEAFLKCWQHRDQIDSLRSLKAWIFQVALNTGRDMRGTAWRRRRRDLPDSVANDLPSLEEIPSQLVEHREEIARLRVAVSHLKHEEKEVFLMRENGDLTYEQIAESIDIPVGTVKTRMRSALSKLRSALKATS